MGRSYLRMVRSLCIVCFVLGFSLMAGASLAYNWHTFHGGSGHAGPSGTVVDASGNIYVTGISSGSWNGPNGQAPLNSGGVIFVMKLDSSGAYQWHTFFGGSGNGTASDGIAIDRSGNLYILGQSTASWNGPPPTGKAPLNPFSTSSGTSFILKLDSNGAYQWHTFYPTNTYNFDLEQPDNAIAVDGNGGVYLTGKSNATWTGPNGNLPLNPYQYHCPSGFACNPAATFDIFVLKLNSSGAYQWHTFYGSGAGGTGGTPVGDFGWGIGTDNNNNVYVSAQSPSGTWNGPNGQLPRNGYPSSASPTFPAVSVLKLDTNGAYQWHTFYGPSLICTMAVEAGGNVYVTGGATAGSWTGPAGHAPLNNYTSGEENIFVLKLDSAGAYVWHTFYPGSGQGIALDNNGNVFATGPAFSAWNGPAGQLPLYPFELMGSLDTNILVLALNNAGTYQWHTFYPGSSGGNSRNCNTTQTINGGNCTLAADASGNVYIAGLTEMDSCGQGVCNGWNGPNGQLPLNQDDGGTFVLKMAATVPLSVMVSGTGSGSVISQPTGINCSSGTCTVSYAPGTPVTLNATALAGSTFAGWTGCDSTSGATCSLTMNNARTVTATFNAATATLPTVTTTAATLITSSGATLNGDLDPNGTSTSVWFEWSTSSTLATYSSSGTATFSGSSTINLSLPLTGLLPGTPYYYRIAAFNDAGTVQGAILSFTTLQSSAQPALRFLPLTPCRIADTRTAPNGPLAGPSLGARTPRSFPIPTSPCLSGVPSTVAAYSLNVTAVPHTSSLGYLTIWPSGQAQPLVSTLNSLDGRVKANAAIVPAGTSGAINVYVTDPADVILDINGYFVPTSNTPPPLAFFPLTPCRVADTRNTSGPLGGPSLAAGGQGRSFPVLSSSCGIPTDGSALAYSLNFTVVPHGPLGYLTTWPTGVSQPLVSTLNAPTGTVTANAAIVPAGNNGAISVYVKDASDVVIDVIGYFAPSTKGTDLSLYTLPPCRAMDTRGTTGLFSGPIAEDMTASSCGVPLSAQAVVLNATVVPAQGLGFLSLWPYGQAQPLVSTLNANDGLVTSNMAVVPTSSGKIAAYATDPTQLVLDTCGYFAAPTN